MFSSGPVRICLRGSERRELQRIVRAHTFEYRLVLRSRIVLLAASGCSNAAISREVRCELKTVRKWRQRFASMRMDGLDDSPRSGRPPVFTASQRHDVFATLVGEPPFPYARWTVDLLADRLVQDGVVGAISRETVSLWLRTADIKPHRCKYWLTSNDPLFKVKKDRIVDLYTRPPNDGQVICIDEKTSIQAVERIRPDIVPSARRPRRIEFEYKRHGVVHLIAAFVVRTGRVLGKLVEKNDSRAFIRFLRQIMKACPTGKLYLVLDNGTTHRSKETQHFFAQHPRLVPVFLPTHASWLNQVEIWFSLLSRQSLRNVSCVSREALAERIRAYIRTHNRLAHPFSWSTKGKPLAA